MRFVSAVVVTLTVAFVMYCAIQGFSRDDTRRDDARAALCTKARADANVTVLSRPVGDLYSREVFVEPLAWSSLDFQTREAWAYWASECLFRGLNVEIRHGKTGKTLATYGDWAGYESAE